MTNSTFSLASSAYLFTKQLCIFLLFQRDTNELDAHFTLQPTFYISNPNQAFQPTWKFPCIFHTAHNIECNQTHPRSLFDKIHAVIPPPCPQHDNAICHASPKTLRPLTTHPTHHLWRNPKTRKLVKRSQNTSTISEAHFRLPYSSSTDKDDARKFPRG